MRVHLIGMGVTGSLIARLLEHTGISFTWHDTETEHVAWKAATGAVYPCGKPGRDDYETWREWLGDIFLEEKWWELAHYWYNHKKAPHASSLKAVYRSEGGLGLSPLPSIHVNSQALVPLTQARYARLRRAGAEEADFLVRATGFNPRMDYAYWGWSCLIELGHSLEEGPLRPCLYLRDGRFVMTYAYPVPGRPEAHYAGSCFLRQTPEKMHSLKTFPKYEKWKENFERLTRGEAKVLSRLADPVEGWRPAMASGEEDTSVKSEGKTLTVPPLGGSGIRRLPSVWCNLKNFLNP